MYFRPFISCQVVKLLSFHMLVWHLCSRDWPDDSLNESPTELDVTIDWCMMVATGHCCRDVSRVFPAISSSDARDAQVLLVVHRRLQNDL